MKKLLIVLILMSGIAMLGCNGAEEEGDDSSSTEDKHFSTAVNRSEVAPGDECAYGGIKVETGVDENGNGSLETSEVDSTDTSATERTEQMVLEQTV